MGNMKIAILNLFANEVVVKCSMFHTRVEHWVREEVGCTDIVAIDDQCPSREETELAEYIGYPKKLGSRGSNRSVFSFSGGLSNCALFLRTPRDWNATEVENEGVGRGKIILIAGPFSVRVGM